MMTCRRILLSAKNGLLLRPYIPPGRHNKINFGVAWCSSDAGKIPTQSSHTTTPESNTIPSDTTSVPTIDVTSVGWDANKVEQMLQEASQKDMPIEMRNPYEKERVRCLLCQYDVKLDYKNPRLLSQFVSPYTGRLYDRNVTRLCKKQQEVLSRTITASRTAGFMPVMLKDVKYLKDPKLFDPNNPIRPHNF